MKRIHTIYYAVFISLMTVGVQKAADDQLSLEVAANIVLAGVSSTESQSSPRDQDSPRTQAQKSMQKASSFHAHSDEPRAGQAFPNMTVPQSTTSDCLASIAGSSEESSSMLTLTMSSSPKPSQIKVLKAHYLQRDFYDDAVVKSFHKLSVSPTRKGHPKKLNTLAALRKQFPAVRTGLAEEAKSTMPSQEQTATDATEGIQVES